MGYWNTLIYEWSFWFQWHFIFLAPIIFMFGMVVGGHLVQRHLTKKIEKYVNRRPDRDSDDGDDDKGKQRRNSSDKQASSKAQRDPRMSVPLRRGRKTEQSRNTHHNRVKRTAEPKKSKSVPQPALADDQYDAMADVMAAEQAIDADVVDVDMDGWQEWDEPADIDTLTPYKM